MEPWIQTYTGKAAWLFEPGRNDYDIVDIAHALANLCRFNGHCRRFYSVAQHSVILSHAVAPGHALWGLLHDAAEAYLGDVTQPFKEHLDVAVPNAFGYRRPFHVVERWHERRITAAFGLDGREPEQVKEADLRLLATEVRDLMTPDCAETWSWLPEPYPRAIIPLQPEIAEQAFLHRFEALTGRPVISPTN